jgi:hypothetical protein
MELASLVVVERAHEATSFQLPTSSRLGNGWVRVAVRRSRPMAPDDAAGHLRDFPLAWRWTDPRWNVLPSWAIRRVHPVDPATAKQGWPRVAIASESLLRQAGLITSERDRSLMDLRPESVARIDAKGDASTVGGRLAGLGLCRETSLTVTWKPDVAVTVAADVFCEFWDDFCYPASDDVVVLPTSDAWVLMYYHEQEFLFGRLSPIDGVQPEA